MIDKYWRAIGVLEGYGMGRKDKENERKGNDIGDWNGGDYFIGMRDATT